MPAGTENPIERLDGILPLHVLGILAQHGSQFVTRPTLFDYYLHPGERAAGAARVFEMIESGAVRITVGQRYSLEDAARAHADLEAGRTTGSSLLIPEHS